MRLSKFRPHSISSIACVDITFLFCIEVFQIRACKIFLAENFYRKFKLQVLKIVKTILRLRFCPTNFLDGTEQWRLVGSFPPNFDYLVLG